MSNRGVARTSGKAGNKLGLEGEHGGSGDGPKIREKRARASLITSERLIGGRCVKLGFGKVSIGTDGLMSSGDESTSSVGQAGVDVSASHSVWVVKGAMERLKGGLYAAYA